MTYLPKILRSQDSKVTKYRPITLGRNVPSSATRRRQTIPRPFERILLFGISKDYFQFPVDIKVLSVTESRSVLSVSCLLCSKIHFIYVGCIFFKVKLCAFDTKTIWKRDHFSHFSRYSLSPPCSATRDVTVKCHVNPS